jgi:hypothetical protein
MGPLVSEFVADAFIRQFYGVELTKSVVQVSV